LKLEFPFVLSLNAFVMLARCRKDEDHHPIAGHHGDVHIGHKYGLLDAEEAYRTAAAVVPPEVYETPPARREIRLVPNRQPNLLQL